ncbi:MAG: hypothetical protein GY719_31635 [bacterium]|nr:hypothetical protein [bacterium]
MKHLPAVAVTLLAVLSVGFGLNWVASSVGARVESILTRAPVHFANSLRTSTINGMTLTRYKDDPNSPEPACWTLTQDSGESDADFIARADKSYKAWCMWLEDG